MMVSTGQRAGMLAVLLVCLAIYGFSSFTIRQPRQGEPIPLVLQNADFIAVELRGFQGEGIYFLPPGAAPQSLIEAAGVKTPGYKESLLGAKISQGALFTVAGDGSLQRGEMSAATRVALGIPLDVNRASAGDLALVPGIGEGDAARIVQRRRERGNLSSLADLSDIPGIKEKKLEKIRDYLTTGLSR
ncbi:MAG: ComEA family DNA-binding protein [Syntrophales bacterium]